MITPKQIAQEMGVNVSKVLTWIHRGELRAINVSTDGSAGLKPRWRIRKEDFKAFCSGRENEEPKPRKRKSQSQLPAVTQYFT